MLLPLLAGCNCHSNASCVEGCAGGDATGGGRSTAGGEAQAGGQAGGGASGGASGGAGGGASGGRVATCFDGGVCFHGCAVDGGAPGWPTRVRGLPAGNSAALGDVDGDGRLDLAVGDTQNVHDLYVAMGSPAGFEVVPDALSGYARQVLLADVTGDGLADLIEVSTNGVQVHVSAGDGGFLPRPVDSPGGPGASQSVALDIDGDGQLDLAVTSFSPAGVAVHRGLGGGAFQRQPNLPAGRVPWRIVTANLNGDRWPDLVVGDGFDDGGVEAFVSNGDFTFQPWPRTPMASPSAVMAADLDGDGRDEVYAANGAGLYRVTAPGALEQLTGGDYFNVLACDTDADGRREILAQLKEGLVTFDRVAGAWVRTHGVTLDTLVVPDWLLCEDFDGDGADDVLAPLDEEVVLFRGGPEGLRAPPAVDTGPFQALWLEAADLDEDGLPDLVGAIELADAVDVWFNEGGALLAPLRLRVGSRPRFVKLVDLDGDGRRDVVTADRLGTVSAIKNRGGRTFSAALSTPTGLGPRELACVDADLDGRTDVMVACEGVGLNLLHGTGPGTLGSAEAVPGAPRARSVATGDFDGDGRADLVTSGGFTGARVLRSEGDGGFRLLGTAGQEVYDGVAVADFDRDGRLDVVGTSYRSAVWYGDGAGGFSRSFELPPVSQPSARDLDGDEWSDVVTISSPWFIDVFHNQRDAGFAPGRAVFSGSHPASVVIADFNGDGLLDVVAATQSWPMGGSFTLLDGTCGWASPR